MTIKGLSTVILEMFASQDIISLEEVSLIIKDQINDKDLAKSLAKLAMEDLQSFGLIKNLQDSFYVLVKPLSEYSQTLQVDAILGTAIAKVLNRAATLATGKETEICSALNITDKDIELLTQIADSVNQQPKSKFDEMSWLKDI